jgi:hypothetical protein
MKKFKKKQSLHAEWIDGEVFIMDTEAGKYYAMNRAASFVWMQLDNPKSLIELKNLVMRKYDVDESRCNESITELLERMCKMKMIVEVA